MRAKPSFLATLGVNLRDLADGASAGFERAVNEDRIKVAVTGLSRAGKTVFITSLIQNLVTLGGGRNTLPGLNEYMLEGGVSRLRGIRVEHAGASLLPYFDHAAKFRDLASELPTWPPRTEDLAQVSLTIDLEQNPISLAHTRLR